LDVQNQFLLVFFQAIIDGKLHLAGKTKLNALSPDSQPLKAEAGLRLGPPSRRKFPTEKKKLSNPEKPCFSM